MSHMGRGRWDFGPSDPYYTEVDTYADLPTSNISTGDIYIVKTTTWAFGVIPHRRSGLWRYDGSSWVRLGTNYFGAMTVSSITDGTASWTGNDLLGFHTISGNSLTDGTATLTSGALTCERINLSSTNYIAWRYDGAIYSYIRATNLSEELFFYATSLIELYSENGAINIEPNGDESDYFQFTTVANVPTLTTVGDCNLKITASSGTIDFDDEYLQTTGQTKTRKLLVDVDTYSDWLLEGQGLPTPDIGYLDLQAQSSGHHAYFRMFTKDGDGTDSVGINICGKGTPDSDDNIELLSLLYQPIAEVFQIATDKGGTGSARDLDITTWDNINQLYLDAATGDVSMSGDLQVDGGNIGITGDTDLMALAANALTVNGEIKLSGADYIGWWNGGARKSYIQGSTNADDLNLYATDKIRIQPSDDVDYYFEFSTVSQVPIITAGDGNIIKVDDTLQVTGNIGGDGLDFGYLTDEGADAYDLTGTYLHIDAGTGVGTLNVEGNTSAINMAERDAAANEHIFQTIMGGGSLYFRLINDNLTTKYQPLQIDMATGALVLGSGTNQLVCNAAGDVSASGNFVGDIKVSDTTGVALTAADGVLTMAGLKAAGNNENITFDFESTTNIVAISSGSGANLKFARNFTVDDNTGMWFGTDFDFAIKNPGGRGDSWDIVQTLGTETLRLRMDTSGHFDFQSGNITTLGKLTCAEAEINGDLNHDGTNAGFFGTAPVSQRLKANYNNWAALGDVVDALVALGLFDQA